MFPLNKSKNSKGTEFEGVYYNINCFLGKDTQFTTVQGFLLKYRPSVSPESRVI